MLQVRLKNITPRARWLDLEEDSTTFEHVGMTFEHDGRNLAYDGLTVVCNGFRTMTFKYISTQYQAIKLGRCEVKLSTTSLSLILE